MPIEFTCQQCQNTLRVPDDSAGKKSRCPQCGNVQQIPLASAPVSQPQPQHQPGFGSPQPHSPPAHPYAQSPATNPYLSPQKDAYAPPPVSPDHVRSKVRAPAIAMLICAVLGCVMIMLTIFAGVMTVTDQGGAEPDDVMTFIILGVCLLLELGVVAGSVQMLRFRTYPLAMAAAILSLCCGICCLPSLAFGIWALVVLLDNNVREQFV